MSEPTTSDSKPCWRSFDSSAELDAALAAHLAGALRADIARRGAGSLALSGGNTPQAMFRALSREQLPWTEVALTLVDERWVDSGHADSNERLLRDNLLQNAAATARLAGLKTPHPRATEGEGEANARVAALPRPFTAVVLGMGGDGHTASWFPQAANLHRLLDSRGTDLVAATEPVTAPHARMTLTLPAVLASGEIIVHITGDEKKAVLGEAIARGYPIAAILQQTQPPVSIWWAPQ
ncbi:6-phosphogluconolactonase [Parahaliea mediterranea]|uniref:6-phosphogluconolactonase n=1 Tax=Parahaliea mediterranea TaxID=651086 RepID=A0A939ILC6_9GAMM|nr:6-phosphogluconolactonase [Parahaliea mediterranea]MBN7796365.1 6-phosphogluconolactonase [Parahaliea mediterranea]